jgi:outer membrane protein OmpA-like peptidoglycan-associated protein
MDIYTFTLDDALRPDPVTYIYGKIINQETREPVSAMVRLTGLERGESFEVRLLADHGGDFFVTLPAGSGYAFHVAEPGYLLYSEFFNIEAGVESPDPVQRTILLTPIRVGSMTHLYNIFFETGSYHILEASEDELSQLYGLLQQNPSLQVEIQGHTDNVGSAEYNLELSEKRALSVVEHLTGRGIDRSRLTSKGYGYQVPVESNDTEWGRSRNRRTTIRITGVLPPAQR